MHNLTDVVPAGNEDPGGGQARVVGGQALCGRVGPQDAIGENKENGHLMMTSLSPPTVVSLEGQFVSIPTTVVIYFAGVLGQGMEGGELAYQRDFLFCIILIVSSALASDIF